VHRNKRADLLDHLVGEREQRSRNGEAAVLSNGMRGDMPADEPCG
jgi:hypothetical protein